MPSLAFAPAIGRHVCAPSASVVGATLGEALDAYFQRYPGVRGYVLDDQGAVRKHVAVFVNETPIRDRARLTDPLAEDDEVYLAQALSGG